MNETKTLYLMRHAKSSWSAADLNDFDRPLNSRGLRDAPEMGRRLTDRGVRPGIILCSPAKRAVQTLEELNLDCGHIQYEECIYAASDRELLTLIRALSDRYRSAMLIGHNPSMSLLAGALSGAQIHNMSTCAVAAIRLEESLWARAGTGTGVLLDMDYPKKGHK
jgi:phosphohistidine phosphatase